MTKRAAVDWDGGEESTDPPNKPKQATEERLADLASTIENQIIPRLVLAHAGVSAALACPDGRLPPTAEEVSNFADLAVAQDMPDVLAQVESMSRDGLSLESVLMDLVSPAAKVLGDQWLNDTRTFGEVTLGLGTLQRVVAILGRKVEPPLTHRGLVVLFSPPGEQHTLAVQLLGELLRHAGWGTHAEPGLEREELLDLVAGERVVMVGVSVNNPDLLGTLEPLIRDVRSASLNPDIGVMVGGADELAELAPQLGAVYCSSARDALDWLGDNAS